MSKAFLQHISQKVGAGLDYELSSNGESYTIVGSSNCTAVSLSIPSMFRGKPVTKIESGTFLNKTNLKRVFIPDSITEIGARAFGGCSNLEHMTFHEYNTISRYSYPFGDIFGRTEYEGGEETEQCYYSGGSDGWKWMTSYIPSSLKSIIFTGNIGGISAHKYGFFHNCKNLKRVSLPNITYLPHSFLLGCKGLESLELSDCITHIGHNALSGIGVKSLIIPDSVTGIGYNDTISGENLESIVFPVSVTSIGFSTFGNTSPLKYFFYRGTAAQWSKVTIDVNNNCITPDIVYYYSETQPTTGGRYWRYLDGVPTVW